MKAGLMPLLAAAALLATVPAQAMCWNVEDTRAAKVRDLETLLASVGDRCVGAGYGGVGDYSPFTRERAGVAASSQRLKARFWTLYGPVDGRERLEAFDAALARQYARVPIVAENCAQVRMLAGEARMAAGSLLALGALADRHSFTPPLAGGVCKVTLARN